VISAFGLKRAAVSQLWPSAEVEGDQVRASAAVQSTADSQEKEIAWSSRGSAMIITTGYANIPVGGHTMRTFIAAPKPAGKAPGILFYSDIFQLTGPMLRACARLAGYGFVVAAPEIYHRLEPPDSPIPFDDAGRGRGLENAARTPVADFDADCRAVLEYLANHPAVVPRKLGAGGFCLGGHLAFRAALQPEVKATVCFYGTGIHNGKLGAEADAESLARAGEIGGELLLIWGALDPHIPEDGRAKIERALRESGVNFSQRLYPAEHAFMRDEGPRYDPEATDQAFGEMIAFYRRVFSA
jgi:carboxymethylenebutenolidase